MKKYITERGATVHITPIPLLLDAIRMAHKFPKPPSYTENVSGEEVDVELTAEDMAAAKQHNPDWYEEHRAEWEAYRLEYRASDTELDNKLLDAIVLEAVEVNLPEDDSWIQRLARFGIEVADGAEERKLAYVRNVVMGGVKDVLAFMAIAGGADVTGEDLAKAEAGFRNILQRDLARGLERETGALARAVEPVSGTEDGG